MDGNEAERPAGSTHPEVGRATWEASPELQQRAAEKLGQVVGEIVAAILARERGEDVGAG